MNIISNTLYWISTGLMIPVIVLLILLFLRSLILIGGFFGQYIRIIKVEKILKQEFNALTAENTATLGERLPHTSSLLVIDFIKKMLKHQDNNAQIERLLSEYEIAADKALSIPKLLTKLGPMLGLMGTLIPMGPALVGLAQGDISSMAYNMQVAFSTTILGLFCSAVGFYISQVRKRWYFQGLTYLQCLSETILQTHK